MESNNLIIKQLQVIQTFVANEALKIDVSLAKKGCAVKLEFATYWKCELYLNQNISLKYIKKYIYIDTLQLPALFASLLLTTSFHNGYLKTVQQDRNALKECFQLLTY